MQMDYSSIILDLAKNQNIFKAQLNGIRHEEYSFKPLPEKWCMLEVVCHLADEEVEDFRTRVASVLKDPSQALPPIDPANWPSSRNYIEQDFETKVADFLSERSKSIIWLKSLANPKWDNTYQHPKLGPQSAGLFLANWLAHDFIHIRQLNRLAYEYLHHRSGINLDYAGNF